MEYSRDLARDINTAIRPMVNQSAASQMAACLPQSEAGPCIYARSPQALPLCELFQSMENCTALEIRASLIETPEIRRLIIENTANYCAYRRGSMEGHNLEVVRSIGCVAPGEGFQQFYRGHPTICVFALGLNGAISQRFAVRGGRLVEHRWCDKVE